MSCGHIMSSGLKIEHRSVNQNLLCDDEIALNDYLATYDYHESSLSSYKVAIIAYIGGYIIRSLGKSISCATCYDATVTINKDADVIDYSFISIKDKGGLIYPSHETLKILKTCETVFKCAVGGGNFLEPKIIEKTNLNMKLRNRVLRSLSFNTFPNLECDFLNEIVNEDLHSTQLTKMIIDKYMRVRLLRYGQYFTEMSVVKNKCGMRQKLNKTILFQNL